MQNLDAGLFTLCSMKVEPALRALMQYVYISYAHTWEKPLNQHIVPERDTFINPFFLLNYLCVSGNMSLIYLDTPIHPGLNLTPVHLL